jgi:hypothetical protein
MKSGYKQIAIISGIGVRDYYKKRGYELRGSYMMKDIDYYPRIMALILLTLIYMIIRMCFCA